MSKGERLRTEAPPGAPIYLLLPDPDTLKPGATHDVEAKKEPMRVQGVVTLAEVQPGCTRRFVVVGQTVPNGRDAHRWVLV